MAPWPLLTSLPSHHQHVIGSLIDSLLESHLGQPFPTTYEIADIARLSARGVANSIIMTNNNATSFNVKTDQGASTRGKSDVLLDYIPLLCYIIKSHSTRAVHRALAA